MKLINVRVLRGFCIGHGHDLLPGDEIKMTEAEFRLRKGQQRVMEIPEEEAKAEIKAEPQEETPKDLPVEEPEYRRKKSDKKGGVA